MKNGLSFGYSSAAEISHSKIGRKEKLGRVGLFLLLAVLLALFFGYPTHSVAHKISVSRSTDVAWDETAQ